MRNVVVENGISYVVETLANGTEIKFPNATRANENPEPDNSLMQQIEDLKTQLAVTNATVDFLLGI